MDDSRRHTRSLALAFVLLVPAVAAAQGAGRPFEPAVAPNDDAALERVRTAIVASVSDRLGTSGRIDVEVLQAPATVPTTAFTATPAPGARLGGSIRFLLVPAAGARVSVVARVSAVVTHVIAARAIPRDITIGPDDVTASEAPLADVLLEPLPQVDEVVAAITRRAFKAGDVMTRSALSRPFAVRAGDTVSMTVRSGSVEARGVGRAVSSGFIGDVIRILRPGSRQPSRARIVAPAAVEILR